MKHIIIALSVLTLSACGLETATTAATGAAVKKQEIEQGQKTMAQAQEKIGEAMAQSQQRVKEANQ